MYIYIYINTYVCIYIYMFLVPWAPAMPKGFAIDKILKVHQVTQSCWVVVETHENRDHDDKFSKISKFPWLNLKLS